MSTEPKLPSDLLQHIQFEGCDVCVVAPEDYDALARERDELGKNLADAIASSNQAIELLNGDIRNHQRMLDTLRAQLRASREALEDIAEYTGEGPITTPWQAIVKDISGRARAFLQSTPQTSAPAKNEGEKT